MKKDEAIRLLDEIRQLAVDNSKKLLGTSKQADTLEVAAQLLETARLATSRLIDEGSVDYNNAPDESDSQDE